MRVLSLFNGVGMLVPALERAGIKIDCFHYSEIDKHANAVMNYRHGDDKRFKLLGDITKLSFQEGEYDLIAGGSPCQSLSIAGAASKGHCDGSKGVIDGKSSLFYEFVRILKEVNPKYYLLENVASMTKDAKKIMDDLMLTLGSNPGKLFCGSLVSAQRRRRFFWTNFNFEVPTEVSPIMLKDILVGGTKTYNNFNDRMSETKSATLGSTSGTVTGKQAQMVLDADGSVPAKYYLSDEQLKKIRWLKRAKTAAEVKHVCGAMPVPNPSDGKFPAVLTSQGISRTTPTIANIGEKTSQANRIYDTDGKAVTLGSSGGGLGAKTGLYAEKLGQIETEYNKSSGLCASQGTRIYSSEAKSNALPSNTQGLDYIKEKHNAVTTALGRQGSSGEFLSSCRSIGGIRRLMPLECARLMCLPDDFCKYGKKEDGTIYEQSDTQMYKMYGNGFIVDVIAHILRNIK